MIDLLFPCTEPGHTVMRRVTEIEITPAVIVPLFRRIQAWNSRVTDDKIEAFYEPTRRYCKVDDVGLLWSNRRPEGLEVHFIFWDGRLRGRELLVREMCYIGMGMEQVDFVYVRPPASERMILAFLKRVGFELTPSGDSVNCTLHSRRRL